MTILKDEIRAAAEKLGFCLCGFTTAEPLTDFVRYIDWLQKECVGTMTFLKREDHIQKRADPHMLLPEARTICVLAVPMGLFPAAEDGAIASYARYIDYHDSIREMADALIVRIGEITGENFTYRVCIDSSPILERSLAVRAGLGWIGKSSMFINPSFGSALFLCEILLSLSIDPDEPFKEDRCGKCRRCIDICPNTCIDPESRTIQADRCAAYLTIEHKGNFTPEQISLVGAHLFGCDECLLVCPWNSKNNGSSPLPLADVLPTPADGDLPEKAFKEKFRGTPVLRTKASGLKRNLDALLQNSGTFPEEKTSEKTSP